MFDKSIKTKISISVAICAAALIVTFVACGLATGQVSAERSPEPLEVRFASVPREVPAIQAAIDELGDEIRSLPPPGAATTQPATSPAATQPSADPAAQLLESRATLRNNLVQFEGQLKELLKLAQALEEQAIEEATRKLTDQILAWRTRTAEVARIEPVEDAVEKAVQELSDELAKANQRLAALSTSTSQAEDFIREGSARQRETLKGESAAAAEEVVALEAGYEAELKGAESEELREAIMARRRAAHARSATLETKLVTLDFREKTVQQELERNRLAMEALRPLVEALTQKKASLQEARQAQRTEELRRDLLIAEKDPIQKLFIELQLIKEESLAAAQRDAAQIRGRFGPLSRQSIELRYKRDVEYWRQLRETLVRLKANDVLEAYEEALREQDEAAREYRKRQAMLDRTFVEQRDLEDLRRRSMSRFDKTAARLKDLASEAGEAPDPEVVELIQKIEPMRIELRREFEEALKLDLVREELRKAVQITRQHVELWQTASRRLYWSRLVTPAHSYFASEIYLPVRDELRDLRDGLLRNALAHTWASMVSQLRQLMPVDWGIIIAGEVFVAAALFWLLRKSRRLLPRPPSAVDAPDTQAIEFLDRLRPRIGKAAKFIIPAGAPAVLVAAFVFLAGLEHLPARVGYVMCCCWLGTMIVPTLLYVAFHASKPRFRVLPCSSVVARHYVRYGYALLVLGVLLVAPALLLWAMVLAPELRTFFGQSFQFLATVVLLIFVLRRELVINLIPRGERGRLAGTVTALRTAYPAVVLLLIILLGLRLTGYAALADYVTIGLAGTVGALLLAWTIYLLIREIIRWMVDRTRQTREAYTPPPGGLETPGSEMNPSGSLSPGAGSRHTPSLALGEAVEDQFAENAGPQEFTPASARFAISSARWLLGIGAMLLALYAWGVRPYEIKQIFDIRLWQQGGQDVTLWRISGALLAVLVAVFVSRGMRQALRLRVYPAHPGFDPGVRAAIDTILHYVIIVIGIYVALQTLRLDFGALAVLFGGLGLGLGLGLQPLIVNFVSGMIMLFERHVRVGDVINLADKQGEVVRIRMRSTLIRTADGLHIVVPNGVFINQMVENWTLARKPVRGVLDVVVTYRSDPGKIRRILLETVRSERLALRSPVPDATFKEMNDSGMVFTVSAWFATLADRGAGLLGIRYALAERFRREGVEIPVKSLAALSPGDGQKAEHE